MPYLCQKSLKNTKKYQNHSLINHFLFDIEGNVYSTVSIGEQLWMAENLKTTRYSDGTLIPLVTDDAAWMDCFGLLAPAYCWYNNDSTTYNGFGVLYNWFTVDPTSNCGKNVCPEGWHVPTDAEWKQLEMYLGMSQSEADDTGYRGTDEGGKMKEAGTAHWNSPNTGATNESGFSALPGGYRYGGGRFNPLGYNAFFWSSTESYSTYAWSRSLSCYYSAISRYGNYERFGFSVRCVRD